MGVGGSESAAPCGAWLFSFAQMESQYLKALGPADTTISQHPDSETAAAAREKQVAELVCPKEFPTLDDIASRLSSASSLFLAR